MKNNKRCVSDNTVKVKEKPRGKVGRPRKFQPKEDISADDVLPDPMDETGNTGQKRFRSSERSMRASSSTALPDPVYEPHETIPDAPSRKFQRITGKTSMKSVPEVLIVDDFSLLSCVQDTMVNMS